MIFVWTALAVLAMLGAGAAGLFRFAIVRRKTAQHKTADPLTLAWREATRAGRAYLATRLREEWTLFSADGLRLHAAWFPADSPTGRTVLAVHGYRSSGISEYASFAAFYHGLGCNLLLVDDRAHGDSEGKYIGFGWLDKDDCLAWAAEIERRLGPGCRVFLHGISMGSATVLLAAGRPGLPACVKAVVADCGYTSAWAEFCHQMKSMFRLPPFPLLPLAGLVCRWRAGYDFRQADAEAAVQRIRVPVLFIHGEKDTYVPTQMGYALYRACRAPKKLLIVPGAGHAQSHTAAPALYERTVAEFLSPFFVERESV